MLIENFCLIALALAHLTSNCVGHPNDFQVPNPFNFRDDGFYQINSWQTTITSSKKKAQIQVVEYFSLSEGLSFSLHRNQDDLSKVFTIIGDGPNNKFYIVNNPDSEDEIDCELDHLHSRKLTFPWQFGYKNSSSEEKNSRKKFIYGVGAIWLNAIDRKLVSNEIGDNSDIEANVWKMREGDLEVKLLFEKPNDDDFKNDPINSVARSKLDSIQIRQEAIENMEEVTGEVNHNNFQSKYILITSFESKLDFHLPEVRKFKFQLEKCREKTVRHKTFPSLMRELSTSPKRFYEISYIERRFDKEQRTKVAIYNEKKRRYTWPIEIHTEILSLHQESQVTIHQGLFKDDETDDGIIEIFLKKFTEAQNARSSRHSTVTYHIFERNGTIEFCVRKEDEPEPQYHLLKRPIHFTGSGGQRLTGRLIGLGALILNAADMNHKELNLFKKSISVITNRENLSVRQKMDVNEWIIYDKKTGRYLHFYFSDNDNLHTNHDIFELVRIDIRHAEDSANEDGIIEKADDDSEDNLIVRYDIISVSTELQSEKGESVFVVPAICYGKNESDTNNFNDEYNVDDPFEDDNQEEESDNSDSDFDPADNYNSDENDDSEEEEEEEAEEFEFEPGKMVQSLDFPDFFEFLDGKPAYVIESKIDLLPEKSGIHITLKESVDIEKEWATLRLSYADESGWIQPIIEYHLNYNSELIFKVELSLDSCSLVDDVDPWLRLLSARFDYFIKLSGASENEESQSSTSVESNRLPLYGVGALWRHASLSEYTDFMGLTKEAANGPGKHKYKEAVWSLLDDGDSDMVIDFKFLWNLTQWELDDAKHRNRRAHELLSLSSIYVSDLVDNEPTNFRKFRIRPTSIDKLSPSDGLNLPESCIGILDEVNKREALKRKWYSQAILPSFKDHISPKNLYSLRYTVTHFEKNNGQSERNSRLVDEYYDLNLNLGKMTIKSGSDTQEIFINGEKKEIYSFATSTKICRKISKIEPLFNIRSFSKVNENFSLKMMYGLAAFWIQAADMQYSSLTVKYRHDKRGNKIEDREYKLAYSPDAFSVSTIYTIRLRFSAKLRTSATTNGDLNLAEANDFELENVDIQLDELRGNQRYKTEIKVDPMSQESQTIILPKECRDLRSDDTQENFKFPKITNIINDSNQFHMRSELTILRSKKDKKESMLLVDEWLYKKNYRIKTFGLERDVDTLIYGSTKESFDLSTPFRCPSALPSLDPVKPIKLVNLMNFWNDNTTLVENLSYLYYGPISLWLLAEKNISNAKLVTSIDIAPRSIGDSKADSMAREMGTEVWRLSGDSDRWSYDLHFEKVLSYGADREKHELHVLDKVVVRDTSYDGSIEVDVINYNWLRGEQIQFDRFLLPEGQGCIRNREVLSDLRKVKDDLFVDLASDYYLAYEASLESVDQSVNVPPSLTGQFVWANSVLANSYEDITAHFSRIRHSNKSVTSTKTVYDSDSKFFYRIDQSTGNCDLQYTFNQINRDFRLEFQSTNGTTFVSLSKTLFREIFKRTDDPDYQPLNKYVIDGKLIITYELSRNFLEIIDGTTSPVTIIRRYESNEAQSASKMKFGTRLHSSLSVKVLMFDWSRTKVMSTLSINLLKIKNIKSTAAIGATNVAQCYGDSLKPREIRHFLIEYPFERDSASDYIDHVLIAEMFTKKLVSTYRIMLSQFDGAPKVEHYRDKFMRIYFKLMDAPLTCEYFKSKPDSTMTDKMLPASEVKLVSTLDECSSWCDQTECVAMSYCSDRTCRIVTKQILLNSNLLTVNLATCSPLRGCAYYYLASRRPTSLNSFAAHIKDVLIERGNRPDQLDKLTLTIKRKSVLPSRFYELDEKFNTINEDENADALIAIRNGDDLTKVYTTFREDYKLEFRKLSYLSNDKSSHMEASIHHANSKTECLDLCTITNCLMMSYCSQSSSCVLVSGLGDIKSLESSMVADETSGCCVSVRDYTSQYIRFDDTLLPRSSEKRLDQYSSLECAAACEATKRSDKNESFDCLSFDSCKLTDSEQPICFLQKNHVMMSQFDRLILDSMGSESHNQNDSSKAAACNHFSKSVLADYDKISDKELNLTSSPVRGLSAEKCAFQCGQEDDCKAFEYCFDDKLKPAQSCRFVRAIELMDENLVDDPNKNLKSLLKISRRCAVYVMKQPIERYINITANDISSGSLKIMDKQSSFISLVAIVSYLIGSLSVGLILQIAFIRFMNRPLLLSSYSN